MNLASLLNPYYQANSFSTGSVEKNEDTIKSPIIENTGITAQVFNERLYVKKTKASIKDEVINIYDLNGVLKIRKKMNGMQTIIDLSSLSHGLYVVDILNAQQHLSMKFYKS